MLERRQEPRARSIFKSAYVRAKGVLQFVTLRNISDYGVCIDAYPGVSQGDEIEVFIDSAGPKKGSVRWIKDGLCGVVTADNDAEGTTPQVLPPRPIRLPLSVEVTAHVAGRREQATLHNISIRGACINSASRFEQGQLISLEILDLCFELASVRWVKDQLFGLRFAKPIHPAAFRELVAKIQHRPDQKERASRWLGCAA